ncbi:MAG: hypothetical protein HFF26_01970 [Oscillospiraceae bacterium]|nr:hypothetical protein [Oscillospiraceae bacterium]
MGPQGPPGPKASQLTITLAADGWSGGVQTVYDPGLLARGYGYIPAPGKAGFEAYAACMVRADDVETDGEITFRCGEVPGEDLRVNIMRIEVE